MQRIVIEEPYEFIPAVRSNFWPALIQRCLKPYLWRTWGVQSVECRRWEVFRDLVAAGNGILLCPNHSRLCDPLVLGPLARLAGTHLHAMASWHLFKQDRFTAFMIRRMGAFSLYREGLDRQSLNCAIEVLEHAERPLVLFPEGAVSRHNDRLMAFMEGTSVIARSAARRRGKQTPPGKVVVLPVAIRYFYRGDVQQAVRPVLADLEQRLTWQPQEDLPVLDRVNKLADSLLTLKEIEYTGHPGTGSKYDRVRKLLDDVLQPLEEEWGITEIESGTVARVKRVRSAILPDMIHNRVDEAERLRRWRQLSACYYAQAMSCYPRDYIQPGVTPQEHLLETVERFEEDLTDQLRQHRPFDVVVEVGNPIEVTPKRHTKGTTDPVMEGIASQLNGMLADLSGEADIG